MCVQLPPEKTHRNFRRNLRKNAWVRCFRTWKPKTCIYVRLHGPIIKKGRSSALCRRWCERTIALELLWIWLAFFYSSKIFMAWIWFLSLTKKHYCLLMMRQIMTTKTLLHWLKVPRDDSRYCRAVNCQSFHFSLNRRAGISPVEQHWNISVVTFSEPYRGPCVAPTSKCDRPSQAALLFQPYVW